MSVDRIDLSMFSLACIPVVTDEFCCVHFQVWNFIVLCQLYLHQHVFVHFVFLFFSFLPLSFFYVCVCDNLFSLFNDTMSCKIVVWGGAEPTGEFCYLVKEATLQKLHVFTLFHAFLTHTDAFFFFSPHLQCAHFVHFS